MGNGLLKGALSGAAVGAILVAGVSILSQPRVDPAPPAPLPRVSSETAGAAETPPPPPESSTPADAPPAETLPAEPAPPAGPAAEPPPTPPPVSAPDEATPPAFDPPPPPGSEPPAAPQSSELAPEVSAPEVSDGAAEVVIQPPLPPTDLADATPPAQAEAAAPPATGDAPGPSAPPSAAPAIAQGEDAPADAVPPPVETVAPVPHSAQPAPAVTQDDRPTIAVVLLATPEMTDLEDRIASLPFPVSVAIDTTAPDAEATVARLTGAGVTVVSHDPTGSAAGMMSGIQGRLSDGGGAVELLDMQGDLVDLPLVQEADGQPAALLDRAAYRAAQSGRAGIVMTASPALLDDLVAWASDHPEVRISPLQEPRDP